MRFILVLSVRLYVWQLPSLSYIGIFTVINKQQC